MFQKYSELLTILLVIRDREDFTFRWLKYAYSLKLPFRLLIADGGSNDVVSKYVKDKNLKSRLDITYVRTEYDNTVKIYNRKISNALKLVTTPYVILADNDDFYSIEGLTLLVSYLDKRKDEYSSCGGTTVHFSIKDGDVYGKKVEYQPTLGVDYDQDKAVDRVSFYLSGGVGLYYNVHKTDFLRNVWRYVVKYDFNNIRMAELLLEMYILTLGKVKYLNTPVYFRQNGEGIGNTAMLSNDFIEEMLQPFWSSEVNTVFDIITANCEDSKNVKISLLKQYKNLIIPPIINGIKASSKQKKDKKIRVLLIKKYFKEGGFSRFYYFFKNASQFLKRIFNRNNNILVKNKHKSITEIENFLSNS